MPSVLHGNDCYSSVIEGCEVECAQCSCSASADCAQVAYCLPAADYPPSEECDLSGMSCSDLTQFLFDLDLTDYEGDVAAALAACHAKVADRIAECDGGAGNGGGGAGGGGAGGEAGHGGQSGHGGA